MWLPSDECELDWTWTRKRMLWMRQHSSEGGSACVRNLGSLTDTERGVRRFDTCGVAASTEVYIFTVFKSAADRFP